MAWTTFALLGQGPATPDMQDADFNALSVRAQLQCTVTGTNTLVLTAVPAFAPAGGVLSFGMNFSAIAANSNTGATTAAITGFSGSFNVYKDVGGGPTALTGGEIVANTLFNLFFDPALNSNAGGFHLVSSVVSVAGGNPTFGTVLAGTITSSVVNVPVQASIALASIASLVFVRGVGSSLQLGGGDFVTRINSTIASVIFGQITPNVVIGASVSFAGVQVLDNILIGQPSVPQTVVSYLAYVSAAGTVVVNAWTSAPVTIAAATLSMRLTDLGFAV